MNDTAREIIERGIGEVPGELRRQERPKIETRKDAPPRTEDLVATAIPKVAAFEETFGALPARFLRAAREAARLSNCVEEWGAVERAHDAIVSERQAA